LPRRQPSPSLPRSELEEPLLAYPAGGELHVVAGGEHYHRPLTPRQMLGLAERFLKAGVEQMPPDDPAARVAAARITTADVTPEPQRRSWRRGRKKKGS
jgi:hypothetical protein